MQPNIVSYALLLTAFVSGIALSTTKCRRNIVSYALLLAAFVSGTGFSGYNKLFGRHLGMNVTNEKMFDRVIRQVCLHITQMLESLWVGKGGDGGPERWWTRELGESSYKFEWLLSHSWLLFPKCHLHNPQLAFGSIAMVWPCMHKRVRTQSCQRSCIKEQPSQQRASLLVFFFRGWYMKVVI